MGWDMAIIALAGMVLVAGGVALFLQQDQAGAVCPIEPCQANFTAQFQLKEFATVQNTFSQHRATIRVKQQCTVPDGSYKIVPCDFDRNYTIVTTTDFIQPIDVNKNIATSLVPLNREIDLIIPENLDRFADTNSIFEAKCWATQTGLNSLSVNAPVRERNVLTDTVFSESLKPFACSELKEIQ